MAGYIEGVLGRDENIVYIAKVSWLSQFWLYILGLLFIAFYFGIIFFILAVLNVLTTELALTNKKVIAKFGFIRRSTIELNLDKVESISVEQGFIGRLFNFGSIAVRGTGGSQAPIPYIANPLEFRRQVNEMLDKMADEKKLK